MLYYNNTHTEKHQSRAEDPPTASYRLVAIQAVTRGLLTKRVVPTISLTGTGGSVSFVVVVLRLPDQRGARWLRPRPETTDFLGFAPKRTLVCEGQTRGSPRLSRPGFLNCVDSFYVSWACQRGAWWPCSRAFLSAPQVLFRITSAFTQPSVSQLSHSWPSPLPVPTFPSPLGVGRLSCGYPCFKVLRFEIQLKFWWHSCEILVNSAEIPVKC